MRRANEETRKEQKKEEGILKIEDGE